MTIKVIHRRSLKNKPKVLVVLGTTASGKTHLGVELAAALNGEIISADSRQVYKGLDVGTGKDLAEYKFKGKNIPYHLIDVASPKQKFNLARYQKLAFKAIEDILQRGKMPIIVGGSGLYLQAIVDNYELREVRPPSPQRAEWEKLTAEKLFEKIHKLKPEFASRLNNSDRHNARRLSRYLEIISAGDLDTIKKRESPYNFLLLGLTWPDEKLREKISARILTRLEKEGMIAEVKKLNQAGLSWERLKSFGLEYKFISQHLLGEISYSETVEKLATASYRFAKRQKTWFKRWEKQGAKIEWIKDAVGAKKKIKIWQRKNPA
jgi:tRNA dimethylallyltransferase